VFTETGVLYRRADASPILVSFLQQLRTTPHQRSVSAADASIPKPKKAPRRRAAARRVKRSR
jgi:hypothetical protein